MPRDLIGPKICGVKTKVAIYNGRHPPIPGTVVGHAIHEVPGNGQMQISCVIQLATPFDSPEGFYVRYLVVPPGGFEVVSGRHRHE